MFSKQLVNMNIIQGLSHILIQDFSSYNSCLERIL